MINPADLNTPQYVLANLSTTSARVTLIATDINNSRVIIDNTAGSTPVFVQSSVAGQTAVFPSSATAPSYGKVVGAGTVQTFRKSPQHVCIDAIRSSGTADLYITVATGE